MHEYRNPIHAAVPFDESQGREDVSEASPDALAFYLERKEVVEGKPSKKLNAGTSIWSRKSVKRSATAHPAVSPAQVSHQTNQSNCLRDEKRREEDESLAINHNDTDSPDWVRPMNSPRSVIPDSKDLPASHSKEIWNSVPNPSRRVRYLIHNPVGPRWYKNHHLIPPSETTPAARPPSFFSSSFPPIAASSSQDRLEDPTRIAGPSRTPSNSPLPTPNSSQTRVEDRPRTRKLSETAHDVVDLLDVTDPWGTNWHHHSPYDIGLVNGAISVDVQDMQQTRSTRSSMDQNRARTIAPSPLSQSTSAINLHVKPVIQIPRKLSKRRASPAEVQDTGRNAVSLPVTPLGTRPSSSNLPKRMSVAAPQVGSSMYTQNNFEKKGNKGGVIGRLVKRFSFLTKSRSDPNKRAGRENDWQQAKSFNPVPDTALRNSFALSRKTSSDKPVSDSGKRVPPPLVEKPVNVDDTPKDIDSSSVASFEAPFSIGRLTITNPDSPGSTDTTPAQEAVPLPPNKEPLEASLRNETTASYQSFPPTPPLDFNPHELPEKSLPPPTPPKKLSNELVSGIRPVSPIVPRQPSPEAQRPEPSSQRPKSTEHPPSTLNETTVSIQGSGDPVTEQPMTCPIAPSPQNSPRPSDQSPSQPSQILHSTLSMSKKAVPSTVASTVPFPTENTEERSQLFYEYDHSPLSAASILANPPTPLTDAVKATLTIPDQPLPPPPSKILTDIPGRQTETFRLVRSPSGNVYSNEKIVAGGEQWEVVGAEKKRKGSSSSKEQSPKEPEPRSHERHHKDRDSKDKKEKEHESRDRDYRRGTKARDSRDGDYVRDSRDKHHHRDSKDRGHGRDSNKDRVRHSKDRDYVRDGRDKDHRDSRDREYHDTRDRDYHDSRDRDYHRKSRDRDYVHESRYHGHGSRDKDYVRDPKDRDRVHHSRDRDHAREIREYDKDYSHDHKSRDSRDRKHKDRESTTQSEKKRDTKAATEADHRHRHRSQKVGEGERATTVPKALHESDNRHHDHNAVRHDSKRVERHQEERESKPTRQRHESFTATVNISTAQTLPLPPTQNISTSRPLGRHPSLSARPTSQLSPADEINALRAKEAWDMERLYKARSMHGDEWNGYPTIPSNHNTPVMTNISPPITTNLHGSSHTAFVHHQPQHLIYHSMPAAPPPIIYSSPLSIPTVSHQSQPTSHRQSRTRVYADSVTSDRKSYTTAHTSNPLPEIPRESTYEIPADARHSEYWTKYAGLATT